MRGATYSCPPTVDELESCQVRKETFCSSCPLSQGRAVKAAADETRETDSWGQDLLFFLERTAKHRDIFDYHCHFLSAGQGLISSCSKLGS